MLIVAAMVEIPLARLNPNARLQRQAISENAFCIIVDDFLKNPNELVEFAAQNPAEFAHPNIGFPGVQRRVDDSAMKDIHRFVRSRMSREYGFMRGRIGIRSLLSLATLQPDALHLLQRICHIDPNPDPGRAKYAGLLYLFNDERLGGTSFFRWNDEALVWKAREIFRNDAKQGESFLKQHFETFRQPPRYMTESNEIGELLITVPPRFNRFVFYPGDIPHSAAITAPERLTDDAEHGRLTLNLFFSALPKAD
jgi:hypothetical protein